MKLCSRQIHEGERIPWGYGQSYVTDCFDVVVVYPIPFNILVRWARDFYFWLGRLAPTRELIAYQKGRDAGIEDGRKAEQVLSDYEIHRLTKMVLSAYKREHGGADVAISDKTVCVLCRERFNDYLSRESHSPTEKPTGAQPGA